MGDVEFTKAIKDSNRLIEKLNSEIEHDEIILAKQLQEDGKMRREELMDLLEEDGETDSDIMNELNDMEKQMISDFQFNSAILNTDSQGFNAPIKGPSQVESELIL